GLYSRGHARHRSCRRNLPHRRRGRAAPGEAARRRPAERRRDSRSNRPRPRWGRVMTLIKLAGGRIVDPANKRDGVGELFLRDGRIIADPGPGAKPDYTYDLAGRVVMAGGIDLHSHLCGGKVNLARTLLPEDHRADSEQRTELKRSGGGRAT